MTTTRACSGGDRVSAIRLPLWVYWTLAVLGLVGATVFTIVFDFDTIDPSLANRLLFSVWGGPITLVIASILVTVLKRSTAS